MRLPVSSRRCFRWAPRQRSGERGAILTTALVTIIPLLIIVTGATIVMTGRNSLLLRSVRETKALLAASAGIEDAAQSAQEGTLVSGQLITRQLARGLRYEYEATSLATDGLDNDGDTLVDEADERAFEVISDGFHGWAQRRLSAIVIEPAPPPTFSAAILTLGTPEIRTNGQAKVSGLDTRIDNGPVLPRSLVHGIATEPPYSDSDLRANYTGTGESQVLGLGGSPSFGTRATPYNLPGLVAIARDGAENTLPPGTYGQRTDLGNAAINDYRITQCPGDLHLASGARGAGILLVSGDLEISGAYRWDGLIVVLGDFTVTGGALVNGAVIQGPGADAIAIKGSGLVRYSSEALQNLPGLTQAYHISGWRERAR